MKTGLQFLSVNVFFLLALGAETMADWLDSLPAFRAACSAIAGVAVALVDYLSR